MARTAFARPAPSPLSFSGLVVHPADAMSEGNSFMALQTNAPSDAEIELVVDRAAFIREETIRLISVAKVGHYASAFSCAELLAALYYGVMRLRPDLPDWPDRDRFLFGKGHAAVALYPIL